MHPVVVAAHLHGLLGTGVSARGKRRHIAQNWRAPRGQNLNFVSRRHQNFVVKADRNGREPQ